MRSNAKKINIEKVQNNLFLVISFAIVFSLVFYVFCVFKTTAYAYDIRSTSKKISSMEEVVLELETEVSLRKGSSDMDKAPELGYVSSNEVVYLKPKSKLFSFSGASDKIR